MQVVDQKRTSGHHNVPVAGQWVRGSYPDMTKIIIKIYAVYTLFRPVVKMITGYIDNCLY
jgi:hypothetical protein